MYVVSPVRAGTGGGRETCGFPSSHWTLGKIKLEKLKNILNTKQTNKLHGLSPRANYNDRATAACR
jgi:hypothetical protein